MVTASYTLQLFDLNSNWGYNMYMVSLQEFHLKYAFVVH
jgi:hypothetical protein